MPQAEALSHLLAPLSRLWMALELLQQMTAFTRGS